MQVPSSTTLARKLQRELYLRRRRARDVENLGFFRPPPALVGRTERVGSKSFRTVEILQNKC